MTFGLWLSFRWDAPPSLKFLALHQAEFKWQPVSGKYSKSGRRVAKVSRRLNYANSLNGRRGKSDKDSWLEWPSKTIVVRDKEWVIIYLVWYSSWWDSDSFYSKTKSLPIFSLEVNNGKSCELKNYLLSEIHRLILCRLRLHFFASNQRNRLWPINVILSLFYRELLSNFFLFFSPINAYFMPWMTEWVSHAYDNEPWSLSSSSTSSLSLSTLKA